LLHFTNEEALSELRQNTVWRSLEREFICAGGLGCEWWDEPEPEPEQTTLPASNKPKPRTRKRLTDLILATIAVSALAGSVAGWYFPWLNLLANNQSSTTKIQQVKE
jgi:ferric-dicitrate binding protein FerR (iron transport regulator)